MIQELQAVGRSWAFRIVAALLIVAFVITLSDSWRFTSGMQSLARIGDSIITVRELRAEMNLWALRQFSRTGRMPEKAEFQDPNLANQLLEHLIIQTVAEKELQKMEIEIGDREVRDVIESMNLFREPSTQSPEFSREQFQKVLKNFELTEPLYVASLRRNLALSRLHKMLQEGIISVPTFDKIAEKWLYQQRKIKLVELTLDSISAPASVSPEDQQQYYKAHINDFMSPELRRFQVAILSPAQIAQTIQLSAADEDAFLKEMFETPPTAEERAQALQQLKREKATQKVFDLVNQLQDAFAGGAKLEEVVRANQLTVVPVPWLPAAQSNSKFIPIALQKEAQSALEAIKLPEKLIELLVTKGFEMQKEDDPIVVQFDKEEFAIVLPTEILKAQKWPYEKIQTDVEAIVALQKRKEQLKQKAQELTQHFDNIPALYKAKEMWLSRVSELPSPVLMAAFKATPGTVQLIPFKDSVFIISYNEQKELVSEAERKTVFDGLFGNQSDQALGQRFKEVWNQTIKDDFIKGYFDYLIKKYAVEVQFKAGSTPVASQ